MLENSGWAILPLGSADMIRINPYYFYGLGTGLSPLESLKGDIPMSDVIIDLYIASNTLEGLFDGFYPFKTCISAGTKLYDTMQEVILEYNSTKNENLNSA